MTRKMLDLEKEFDRMRNQMNNLMSSVFGNSNINNNSLLSTYDSGDDNTQLANPNTMRTPVIDVDEVIASIEVPGVRKEDIQLDVRNGILNIKAEHKDEKEDGDDKKYVYHKSYQGFARSIPIPEYIDEDNVKAKYDNGILKVHMPKKEEARREIKHINIE